MSEIDKDNNKLLQENSDHNFELSEESLRKIRRGLKQSEQGIVKDAGSFVQYINEEDETCEDIFVAD